MADQQRWRAVDRRMKKSVTHQKAALLR